MAILNQVATQIAVKRLSGKAQVSALLSLSQEAKGSTVQTLSSTVFGELVPNTPTTESADLYVVQSASLSDPGTVMLAEFAIYPLAGTSKYQNVINGGVGTGVDELDTGENSIDTYHAYALYISGGAAGFEASATANGFDTYASTTTALGTGQFQDGFYLTGSGKLQIVPEFASVDNFTAAYPYNNKYTPIIRSTDGSIIQPNSGIDWYLDPYAGILFIQDPEDYGTNYNTTTGASQNSGPEIPSKITAFLYVGKYQDEVTFGANDVNFIVSGSDEGFAVGNDDTINFVSGSAGITVVNDGTDTITIGADTDNVTFNQITGSIGSSSLSNVVFTNLGDSAEQIVEGSLRITQDIVAENYIVSSSVTYMTQSFSSGSTIFGDSDNDTHQFTGSISIVHTGSGYGFQMSGSNFLIDYGNSGSVTLGEYNVGAEFFGSLPITGSGLIISQSFTDEATHHNMVKIGETELVDISGSGISDSFLINVRKKALIISSSNLNLPVAKIAPGDTIFYAETSNQEAIKIFGDNLTLGNTSDDTTVQGDNLNLLPGNSTLNMGVGNGKMDDYAYNENKSLLIGQSDQIDTATGTQIKAAHLDNIYPLFYGPVTASAVSSSGLLFASASEETSGGDNIRAIVYDTGSGQFYFTGSYGATDTTDIEADITLLQASASAGIYLWTGSGVGASVSLTETASWNASGDGLTVDFDESGNAFTYTIAPFDVVNSAGTAISGAIDAATASFSESIVGTAYEVEVTNGGTPGDIVIGLPDQVRISSSLQVGTNSSDPDTAEITTSHTEFNLLNSTATTINFGGAATTINMGAADGTVNIAGSTSIAGDLIVQGTTTQLQVTNLNVDDQFILLNSHSADTAAPLDGGIIVQTSGSVAAGALGTALFYDNDANRWALASSSSIAWNDITVTPDQFIVSVEIAGGTPSGAPNDFGLADGNREGMMYVDTSNADGDGNNIWIYA